MIGAEVSVSRSKSRAVAVRRGGSAIAAGARTLAAPACPLVVASRPGHLATGSAELVAPPSDSNTVPISPAKTHYSFVRGMSGKRYE